MIRLAGRAVGLARGDPFGDLEELNSPTKYVQVGGIAAKCAHLEVDWLGSIP